MGSRRQARECALQALYMCDSLNDWSTACVNLYFEAFRSESEQHSENKTPVSTEPTATPETTGENPKLDFARILVDGVVEHLSSIDATVSMASRNWSISRMSRVDRNILRLGAFEINYMSDIPPNVSINEGIEIAKRYGTEDSPMFVNGVLDRVAADFRSVQAHAPQALKKAVNI